MHNEMEIDIASHDTDVVIMRLANIEELLWRILCRVENATLKTEVKT